MAKLPLPTQLIQAPLAGYSCAAMRVLPWRWGGLAYSCSEMLSAKHLRTAPLIKPRYRFIDPAEGPLCIQLSGHDPDDLQYATERVTAWGAQIIDLNCGCPMPKIRKKQCGSKLLADSKKLKQLIKAMSLASPLPVTIKIRVDADSGDNYNRDVAHAAEDAGAAGIIVHGRHWSHRYQTPVSLSDIASIKQAVTIPVIGNGDISQSQHAKHMLEQTGADAIMIARGCIGKPWIFQQINCQLQGKSFTKPNQQQIITTLLDHIEQLINLVGEKNGLLQARKLIPYYLEEKLTANVQQQLSSEQNYLQLKMALQDI